MTPATTPETEEIREIIERAKRLSSQAREVIANELFDSVETAPECSAEVRAAWKSEIARRIAEYQDGEVVTLDAAGSADRIRARLREKFGNES
jgi:putative addiction module component (TIGR02574 family)